MIKKIKVEQLRRGMFVQQLSGPWLDHPFWKKSFLLDSQAEVNTLLGSKVKELFIDTSKGLDVFIEKNDADEVAGEFADRGANELVNEFANEFANEAQEHGQGMVPSAELFPEQSASMAVELGRAAKIVNKSKQAVYAMFHEARLGNAVNLESMRSLVDEITGSVMRNSGALIGLVRLKTKDDYTYMHSIAVCALMIALAKQLKLSDDEIHDAGLAGLLHDIGKMQIPHDILNKPGKLTDVEFDIVKEHPLAGYHLLLKNNESNPVVLDVCLHHHEKMDGTGYPKGLKAEQISLMAKMGAVCDVYDAITSNRPYKAGWCPSESIRKMAEWTKGHFDAVVFEAFVKSVGIYPVGTLVRMESGRIGVIVEQNAKSLLLPKVRVFFSSKAMSYISPVLLDLSSTGFQDKIVSREEAVKWGLKNIDRYWSGEAVV